MALDKFSFLNSIDIDYIDELHQRYLVDKRLVEPSWRSFFDGYEFSKFNYQEVDQIPTNVLKEFRVINLISAYRSRGHLFTKTNPVRDRRKYHPTLEIKNFGLDDEDLLTVFQASEQVGLDPCSLNDIIIYLEQTYCQSIGIEYQYIRHPERVEWIRKNIELKNRPKFSKDQKKHILHKLNQATVFEQFLQKKFVGQKRFSIEGAESLIPALDVLLENGSNLGLKEFVVGMAHRGRLNVLANIFNKTYDKIFSEFEGKEYDILVMSFDRLGYANLPKYMETLALNSKGAWFIVWNDDALMESQDWDKEIVSYTGQFKLLAFKDNHNKHPYSIFPIVPRDWVVLFGTISPQQAIDAWVSQVAYVVDCFQRIEATVTHDRHDLTGNNNDTTYAEREFLEGDPTNPKDAFHPDMITLKQQYVEKVVWFLKCIGQDTGRWAKVLRKEVEPFALMHANDPNKHLGTFRQVDGKTVNVRK